MSGKIPFCNKKRHGALLSVNCKHNCTLWKIFCMKYSVLSFIEHILSHLEEEEQSY